MLLSHLREGQVGSAGIFYYMHVTPVALNSHEGSLGSCPPSACKITHYSHPGLFQVQLEQFCCSNNPTKSRYWGTPRGFSHINSAGKPQSRFFLPANIKAPSPQQCKALIMKFLLCLPCKLGGKQDGINEQFHPIFKTSWNNKQGDAEMCHPP